jgi:hypothetical protein
MEQSELRAWEARTSAASVCVSGPITSLRDVIAVAKIALLSAIPGLGWINLEG